MNQLSATDEDKETIRDFIEEKNYPALNDFLDTFGDNSITKALKMLPRLFGGEEVPALAKALFGALYTVLAGTAAFLFIRKMLQL